MNFDVFKKELKIDKKHIREVLLEICFELRNIDYFAFYGTLLGAIRDNDVIDGDDDIDLFLENKYYYQIDEIFRSKGFRYSSELGNWNWTTPGIFSQFYKKIKNSIILVDFHFYEIENENIIDKWNIHAKPEDSDKHLHIPKKLIFPIIQKNFLNYKIKVPNNYKETCRYIYGDDYMIPLKKDIDYKEEIINNKVNTIYKFKEKI